MVTITTATAIQCFLFNKVTSPPKYLVKKKQNTLCLVCPNKTTFRSSSTNLRNVSCMNHSSGPDYICRQRYISLHCNTNRGPCFTAIKETSVRPALSRQKQLCVLLIHFKSLQIVRHTVPSWPSAYRRPELKPCLSQSVFH